MAPGNKINEMEKEFINTKTASNMMESGEEVRKMARGSLRIKMANSLRRNGIMTRFWRASSVDEQIFIVFLNR